MKYKHYILIATAIGTKKLMHAILYQNSLKVTQKNLVFPTWLSRNYSAKYNY